MANLSVIGVNHRTAPVAVREHFALPGRLALRLLQALHADPALEEALVLATCNRTELYAFPRPGQDLAAALLGHLGRLKGAPPPADPALFYRHEGLDAVRHLFRVAASLDSQIVGEHEVLGQVKAAYRLAVQARTTGLLLNRLLHWAFRAGKRVRTETDLGRGSASVAQAAVDLARHLFASLQGRTVLLVGAGTSAERAARALVRAGAGRLVVANRTLYRAQQLAHDLVHAPPGPKEADAEAPAAPADGPPASPAARPADVAADAVGLEDLPAAIARADLVITSTGSPDVVLTYDALAPVLARRDGPLLVVDIALPRDVDPRLGSLPNVYLYNLDDLDRLVEHNLDRRRQEIPRAEAIVEDEVQAFAAWLASLDLAPTIRRLQEHVAALGEAQVQRHGRRFCDADREQLRRFSESLCSQILHRPLAFLRGLAQAGSTSEALGGTETVRRLFGLEPDEAPPGEDPSPGAGRGEQ